MASKVVDEDGEACPDFVRSPARQQFGLVGARADTLAPHTARLYAGDWDRFATFCAGLDARALPASTDTVVAFLTGVGLGHSVRRRALAAIDRRHRERRLPPPGDAAEVRAALWSARTEALCRPRPVPPTVSALGQASLRCPRDLAGIRDRAMLLLLAHGVSRSSLVEVWAEHLRWHAERVHLGPDMTVPRAARHDLCPVRALEDWLRASATRYGPVFRKVTRWGTVEPNALGLDAVRRVLARRLP